MTMITFDHGTARFNYRAVGVAIEDGHILLAQIDDKDGWVFPGGRAELLETSREAVEREMFEELGVPVQAERLLWMVENFFSLDGFDFHEIGMYYLIRLDSDSPHREFDAVIRFEDGGSQWVCRWHKLSQLHKIQIRPPFLNQALLDIPASPKHIVVRDSEVARDTTGFPV